MLADLNIALCVYVQVLKMHLIYCFGCVVLSYLCFISLGYLHFGLTFEKSAYLRAITLLLKGFGSLRNVFIFERKAPFYQHSFDIINVIQDYCVSKVVSPWSPEYLHSLTKGHISSTITPVVQWLICVS